MQDAYALRCMPQVHGPVADAIRFAEDVVTRELNAALERAVRAHPDAWMWGYKRWKWRPSEMPGAYPSYSSWLTKHL